MSFEELLHKVREAKDLNLPFVIYRMPDQKKVQAVVQKDGGLEYSDDFSSSGFVMAPFNTDEKAILFADKHSKRFNCILSDQETSHIRISEKQVQSTYSNQPKKKHLKLVKKAIEEIEKGKFLKTVLSRSEVVMLKDLDVTRVFESLLSKYSSAFVYVWFHPEIGLWAGASPETLLKTKGVYFQTMSLAGTQKFAGTTDVVWEKKELKEQQIVTDHIIKSLKGIELSVSETHTKKAGNLLHLCNEISGQLPDNINMLKNLIDKLHPTAAVCGLPKKEVREFILEEEGYDRSFYTGFLGELNHKNADKEPSEKVSSNDSESNLFVNLRCMQLMDGELPQAIIYVGGGVTLESDPLSEWEETVHKSLIMKSVVEG